MSSILTKTIANSSNFGRRIDMSNDGTYYVVSYVDTGDNFGRVALYKNNNLIYTFDNNDTTLNYGQSATYGYDVVINGNANTNKIIIAMARYNAGRIFIYESTDDGTTFSQMNGSEFSVGVFNFGICMSISDDGYNLVIGSQSLTSSIYRYNGTIWEFKKSYSAPEGVAISGDGNTLAVGNVSSGFGEVSIFKTVDNWDNNVEFIISGPGSNQFGLSLDLNYDGTIIVIGARFGDDPNTTPLTGSNEGYVGVWELIGTHGDINSWQQKGSLIYGDNKDDQLYIVSTNSIGDKILIGTRPEGGDENNRTGYSKLYYYNNDWIPYNSNLVGDDDGTGDGIGDYFGSALDLSKNGNKLIIGSQGHTNNVGLILISEKVNLSNNSINSFNSIGDIIGIFSPIDAGSESNYTYSLEDNSNYPDNTSFTIENLPSNLNGNLKANSVFNSSIKNEYLINVRVTDSQLKYLDRLFIININSNYISFEALPNKYKPCLAKFIYNDIGTGRDYRLNLLFQKINVSSIKVSVVSVHRDGEIYEPDALLATTLPIQTNLRNKYEGIYTLTGSTYVKGSEEIGFYLNNPTNNYNIKIINNDTDIMDTDRLTELISLDQQNIVSGFNPSYITKYFNGDTSIFNDFLTERNTFYYNNIAETSLDSLNILSNTLEIPYNIINKDFYFTRVKDTTLTKETQITFFLYFYNGNIVGDKLQLTDFINSQTYNIDLNTSNLKLFLNNEINLGTMNFSNSGKYFYKTFSSTDLAKFPPEIEYKLSIALTIDEFSEPLVLTTDYFINSLPISHTTTNENSTQINLINLTPNVTKNVSLGIKDNIFNLSSGLTIDNNKKYYLFAKYTFNNKPYYFHLKDFNGKDFASKTNFRFGFKKLLKFLINTATSVTIEVKNGLSVLESYPLNLSNVNIATKRKNVYNKEFLIRDKISDIEIVKSDLDLYDYYLTTRLDIRNEVFSVNYLYRFLINPTLNQDGTYSSSSIIYSLNFTTYSQSYTTGSGGNFLYYGVYYTSNALTENYTSLSPTFDYKNKNIIIPLFDYDTELRKVVFELNPVIEELTVVPPEQVEETIQTNILEDETVTQENKDTVTTIEEVAKDNNLFVESTEVKLNETELKNNNVEKNNVKFVEAVDEGEDEPVANIDEESLGLASIAMTGTNRMNVNGKDVAQVATQNRLLKTEFEDRPRRGIILSKNIRRAIALILGSMVIKFIVTHTIINYELDNNEIPGDEIRQLNYSLRAVRVWSKNNFTAEALPIEYQNSSNDIKELYKIVLPVENRGNYYDILIYDEEYFDILQANEEYIITINGNKQFNLVFTINTNKNILGYDFTDNILNVSFQSSLFVNNYLYFLLNKFSNLTNVTEYFREFNNVVKSINDIVNYDKINYIYTEDNQIIVNNKTFLLSDIFDKKVLEFDGGEVVELFGLAYNGSGIVEIKKRDNIIYSEDLDLFIDLIETRFDNDFLNDELEITEFKEENLIQLEEFYQDKNIIKYNYLSSTQTITINSLDEINNYELLASSGINIDYLEIKYKNETIILDFRTLTYENLGVNIMITSKYIIIYNLRFLGSGGIGDITITPVVIPCFTNTCFILTPDGYKNVSILKENDIVITSDNRNIKIKKIFKTRILKNKEKPRLIKANQYGINKPFIDTYISKKHRYKIENRWTTPEQEKLSEKWKQEILEYFHIQTENYNNDILMVNGLEMETWDGKIPGDIKLRKKKIYKFK